MVKENEGSRGTHQSSNLSYPQKAKEEEKKQSLTDTMMFILQFERLCSVRFPFLISTFE